MSSKKAVISILFSLPFIFIIISGCEIHSNGIGSAPYIIKGRFVCEKDSDAYKLGAINCSFTNNSEKTVKKIYIVFSLFDDKGMPLQQDAMEVLTCIPKKQTAVFSVSLDKYLPGNVNQDYSIDFIYASKIIYEDNSEWSDPLGIKKTI